MRQATFGVIVGNRGCFPGHLCESGRSQILKALEEAEIKAITLSRKKPPTAAWKASKIPAGSFLTPICKKIDGILITPAHSATNGLYPMLCAWRI